METLEVEKKSEVSSTIAKRPEFKAQYENFIGGKFVAPVKGEYFETFRPLTEKYLPKQPDQGKMTSSLLWMLRMKLLKPGARPRPHTEVI